MREKLSIMLDRTFPNTLIEMKKLAAESSHFRADEVPPRQKDKQRLAHIFRELEVSFCRLTVIYGGKHGEVNTRNTECKCCLIKINHLVLVIFIFYDCSCTFLCILCI
jgi:hypothetical protein